MSFEAKIINDLKNTSGLVSVRKLETEGTAALLNRTAALSAASAIHSDAELTPETRAAAMRFELRTQMEKNATLSAAIAKGEADVERERAKAAKEVPAAEHGAELRTLFRSTKEDQRDVLLKNSPEMRKAVAEAPRELSGLGELAHASLRDSVLRSSNPDWAAKHDADMRVLAAARLARDAHKQTTMSTFGVPVETHVTKISAA